MYQQLLRHAVARGRQRKCSLLRALALKFSTSEEKLSCRKVEGSRALSAGSANLRRLGESGCTDATKPGFLVRRLTAGDAFLRAESHTRKSKLATRRTPGVPEFSGARRRNVQIASGVLCGWGESPSERPKSSQEASADLGPRFSCDAGLLPLTVEERDPGAERDSHS